MGQIYLRQEKYKQAEQHFARALQFNPGSSVLRCYMASAQAKQGKTGEALTHLQVGTRPHTLLVNVSLAVGLSGSACNALGSGLCATW